jgi:hypothetical protein
LPLLLLLSLLLLLVQLEAELGVLRAKAEEEGLDKEEEEQDLRLVRLSHHGMMPSVTVVSKLELWCNLHGVMGQIIILMHVHLVPLQIRIG